MNWLDLAARKGHAPAQALLGEMMFNGEAGGRATSARLMYLTWLANRRATPRDQGIIDLHAKALASASEADRRAAVAMLENYLRHRD